MSIGRWTDRYITIVGDTRWQASAACRNALHLFFEADTTDAKDLCWRCPVRQSCLNFALDNNCDAGVWGGLDADERKALRRTTA